MCTMAPRYNQALRNPCAWVTCNHAAVLLWAVMESQFFDFFNFLFFKPKKAFFLSKKTFFCPTLPIKKDGKMANFGPKPWKNVNFSTFSTSSFYSLGNRFLVLLQYRKTPFPGLDCLKNKIKKWAILDKNHGLTPLEKSQFLDFVTFIF